MTAQQIEHHAGHRAGFIQPNESDEHMTTTEAEKKTGVPRATIAAWISKGIFVPRGGLPHGRGDAIYLDELDCVKIRAIAAITKAFGDGELRELALARTLPALTLNTCDLLVEKVTLPL